MLPILNQAETDIYNMITSSQISNSSFHNNWLTLVELCSEMVLTHKDDKLPALSGLAHRFQKMPQKVSHQDYIAGIWKQNLAPGLAWHVAGLPDKKARRPFKYRAPSFSWACVDDSVSFMQLDNHDDVAFVDSDIVLEGSDPFGKIRSGVLVLSGLVQRAIIRAKQSITGDIVVCDLEMTDIGSMWNDAKDDIPYGEVTCLKLSSGISGVTPGFTSAVFLVLVPTLADDKDCAVFRRVGLGDTWSRGYPSNHAHRGRSFFDDAQRRVVTIV